MSPCATAPSAKTEKRPARRAHCECEICRLAKAADKIRRLIPGDLQKALATIWSRMEEAETDLAIMKWRQEKGAKK